MPARLRRRQRGFHQAGFTLVEQISALALLGTVSATALPPLLALHDDARATTLSTLAAGAAAAVALNQAGCLLTGGQAEPGKCQPLHDCADVAALLSTDLPDGYTLPSQPLAAGGGTRCSVQRRSDGASAGFHGVATGG